jgi:alanine dehydrogenase
MDQTRLADTHRILSAVSNLQKIPADVAAADDLRCSFCGKPPAEESDLIGGRQVFICDECIATCSEMVSEQGARTEEHVNADNGEEEEEQEIPTEDEPHQKPMFVRFLSEADIVALLTTSDLIAPMETALRQFSLGQAVQPLRTVLPVDEGAFFATMPAYFRQPAVLGAKLVTLFKTNAALDLPTHLATIVLLSAETGVPLAILDGSYITEVRTAAVSAVSANLLARDDAAIVGIIGSGVQARSHLLALEEVFELSEVRVWSPTAEHQLSFVEDMKSGTKARLVSAESAEEAVQTADLVVLATTSSQPVVQSDWIKAGAHVMSVGACRPDQREMDPALVRRATLFVDSRVSALAESGDIVLGIQERLFTASHIVGELGELAAGKVEGRRSPRDVTVFKSLGLAIEDLVAADLAYRRAVAQGIGRELEI